MEIKHTIINTVKKNKLIIIFGVFLAGISIATSLAIPFITQYAIDEGITNKNMKLLGIVSIGLIVLAIIGYISEISNIYIFSKISKEFINSIFGKLLRNLCVKKRDFFINHNSGEINQRINEAWDLEELFSSDFFSSLYSLPMLIVAIIVLINTSVQITIITLIGVCLSIVFLGLSNAYIGLNMPEAANKKVSVSSKIQEIILGIFDIRANQASPKFISAAENAVKEKCSFSLGFTMKITKYMRASSLISSLLSIVLLYFCGMKIIDNSLTFGNYFLIVAYVEKITEPIMNLTGLIAQIKPLIVTSSRVEELFGVKDDDLVEQDWNSNDKIKEFCLNNICFRYPDSNTNVLTNVSLKAELGDVVLIHGKNGSGKSTLLNIISGELKANYGYVTINSIKKDAFYDLSIAIQHPFIFNLSLSDNIILFEDKETKKYNNICNYLQFDKYFDSDLLNDEIEIQENGKSLSGGQIKLIALARCLYRNRTVIVFDEIISNLDNELRKIVIEYIKQNRNSHIFLLVEHTNEYDTLANKHINLQTIEEKK